MSQQIVVKSNQLWDLDKGTWSARFATTDVSDGLVTATCYSVMYKDSSAFGTCPYDTGEEYEFDVADFESSEFSVMLVGFGEEDSKGFRCCECNDLHEFATKPNQEDGTFKCYKCRSGF
jgi:hypothetical protein